MQVPKKRKVNGIKKKKRERLKAHQRVASDLGTKREETFSPTYLSVCVAQGSPGQQHYFIVAKGQCSAVVLNVWFQDQSSSSTRSLLEMQMISSASDLANYIPCGGSPAICFNELSTCL